MADRTTIAWAQATWNPYWGCSHASRGCDNCYAERKAVRFATGPRAQFRGVVESGHWSGRIALAGKSAEAPLTWRKPRRIFVGSMGDIFHESVPIAVIHQRVLRIMAAAPQHRYLLLTKRPARLAEAVQCWRELGGEIPATWWFGVSAEDQAALDHRWLALCNLDGVHRWLSAEPLLGPLDLATCAGTCQWVVAGGETGPGARSCREAWWRPMQTWCRDRGVSFFLKQLGDQHPPMDPDWQLPQAYPEGLA